MSESEHLGAKFNRFKKDYDIKLHSKLIDKDISINKLEEDLTEKNKIIEEKKINIEDLNQQMQG